MNIEELRELCLELPGSSEDVKWGNDLCFVVHEKMFLVTGLNEDPTRATFKVEPEDFEEIAARDGFRPAPYLARAKWVSVDDINCMSREEWKDVITTSYNLIVSKLPKKVREELNR